MSEWQLTETFRSTSGDVRWGSLGQPGREPVVLLHGTPFSSYVWRAVARALSRHHQVFVWDMPGYGASEMAAGQDVSLAAQGRVFTQLLAHWGLAEPLVVAHDFGGAVCLRAHLLHGARYRALALVDPVALAPWGSPFFRLVGEHSDVFEQLPPVLHRALVREYVSSASSPGLHPAVLDRLPGGLLPSDRAGRPAPHRRSTGPVRRDQHPDTGVLGPGRHLDPRREGTGARRRHPGCAARAHRRCGPPRPGRRACRTHGRPDDLPPPTALIPDTRVGWRARSGRDGYLVRGRQPHSAATKCELLAKTTQMYV